MEALIQKKVTIYARGEFIGNFHKIEATAYKVELVAHAQYADAVRFVYKGKGKRILRGSVQSYQPSLVVLEGWGHVEPPSMWNKGESMGNGVTVQHATHMAYDEGWSRDFGVVLDEHIAKTGAKILHDYRAHKPSQRLR